MRTPCVVGFVFNEKNDYVALIRKNRPPEQAGKLNGVGGKVEPNEAPVIAMQREFEEEAGEKIHVFSWDFVAKILYPNALLYVYTSRLDDNIFHSLSSRWKPPAPDSSLEPFPPAPPGWRPPASGSMNSYHETEQIEFVSVENDLVLHKDVMPNLKWMIPFCLNRDSWHMKGSMSMDGRSEPAGRASLGTEVYDYE